MSRQQIILLAALGVGLFLFSSRSRAATVDGDGTVVQPVNRTVTSGGGGGGFFSSLLPGILGGDDAIADSPQDNGSTGGGITAGDKDASGGSTPDGFNSGPKLEPPTVDDDASEPYPVAPGGGGSSLPEGTRIGSNVLGDAGTEDKGAGLRVQTIGPRMNLF